MLCSKVEGIIAVQLYTSLTLGLHTCSNESQGVGGQLSTGTRHSTTAQQYQHPRVGRALTVPLEPGILQSLRWKEGGDEREKRRKE